jgi:hypothetical protein
MPCLPTLTKFKNSARSFNPYYIQSNASQLKQVGGLSLRNKLYSNID